MAICYILIFVFATNHFVHTFSHPVLNQVHSLSATQPIFKSEFQKDLPRIDIGKSRQKRYLPPRPIPSEADFEEGNPNPRLTESRTVDVPLPQTPITKPMLKPIFDMRFNPRLCKMEHRSQYYSNHGMSIRAGKTYAKFTCKLLKLQARGKTEKFQKVLAKIKRKSEKWSQKTPIKRLKATALQLVVDKFSDSREVGVTPPIPISPTVNGNRGSTRGRVAKKTGTVRWPEVTMPRIGTGPDVDRLDCSNPDVCDMYPDECYSDTTGLCDSVSVNAIDCNNPDEYNMNPKLCPDGSYGGEGGPDSIDPTHCSDPEYAFDNPERCDSEMGSNAGDGGKVIKHVDRNKHSRRKSEGLEFGTGGEGGPDCNNPEHYDMYPDICPEGSVGGEGGSGTIASIDCSLPPPDDYNYEMFLQQCPEGEHIEIKPGGPEVGTGGEGGPGSIDSIDCSNPENAFDYPERCDSEMGSNASEGGKHIKHVAKTKHSRRKSEGLEFGSGGEGGPDCNNPEHYDMYPDICPEGSVGGEGGSGTIASIDCSLPPPDDYDYEMFLQQCPEGEHIEIKPGGPEVETGGEGGPGSIDSIDCSNPENAFDYPERCDSETRSNMGEEGEFTKPGGAETAIGNKYSRITPGVPNGGTGGEGGDSTDPIQCSDPEFASYNSAHCVDATGPNKGPDTGFIEPGGIDTDGNGVGTAGENGGTDSSGPIECSFLNEDGSYPDGCDYGIESTIGENSEFIDPERNSGNLVDPVDWIDGEELDDIGTRQNGAEPGSGYIGPEHVAEPTKTKYINNFPKPRLTPKRKRIKINGMSYKNTPGKLTQQRKRKSQDNPSNNLRKRKSTSHRSTDWKTNTFTAHNAVPKRNQFKTEVASNNVPGRFRQQNGKSLRNDRNRWVPKNMKTSYTTARRGNPIARHKPIVYKASRNAKWSQNKSTSHITAKRKRFRKQNRGMVPNATPRRTWPKSNRKSYKSTHGRFIQQKKTASSTNSWKNYPYKKMVKPYKTSERSSRKQSWRSKHRTNHNAQPNPRKHFTAKRLGHTHVGQTFKRHRGRTTQQTVRKSFGRTNSAQGSWQRRRGGRG